MARLTDDRDIYYYEQHSPFVHLSLLGDYRFQPYKTKYFRDIDRRFIEYSTQRFNNIKPEILYAAHTIIQPYYSSVFVLYKNCTLDSTGIKDINLQLRSGLHTSYSKYKEVRCGTRNPFKISYQVKNSLTGIYSSHTEYIFGVGANVYCLFLWTTNSDDSVISNEAEYISKEAKFE
jgi:hypothetical protein